MKHKFNHMVSSNTRIVTTVEIFLNVTSNFVFFLTCEQSYEVSLTYKKEKVHNGPPALIFKKKKPLSLGHFKPMRSDSVTLCSTSTCSSEGFHTLFCVRLHACSLEHWTLKAARSFSWWQFHPIQSQPHSETQTQHGF